MLLQILLRGKNSPSLMSSTTTSISGHLRAIMAMVGCERAAKQQEESLTRRAKTPQSELQPPSSMSIPSGTGWCRGSPVGALLPEARNCQH